MKSKAASFLPELYMFHKSHKIDDQSMVKISKRCLTNEIEISMLEDGMKVTGITRISIYAKGIYVPH